MLLHSLTPSRPARLLHHVFPLGLGSLAEEAARSVAPPFSEGNAAIRASHKRKPQLNAGAAFTRRIAGFRLGALKNPHTRGM
jgi:hypothetical protein